uniref:Uncharacterized protein n=1 Tax=Sinocyclocheilus grahami TaxID=75366 RepID=A0A672K876_SINGR
YRKVIAIVNEMFEKCKAPLLLRPSFILVHLMWHARKAVREIKARSHNMNVLYMEVDLANMRSIREFSKTFLQKEKRLDILINNAG